MSSISILMCSFNGDKLLPSSVSAISRLNTVQFDFVEFVFVDNNSTNDLQVLVRDIWSQNKSSITLKTIQEKKKGKTSAFLTGFSQCFGELTIICDDDNLLCENYLIEAISYFNDHPYVGVLGGCGTPISEVDIPDWLNNYLPDFACGPQAQYNGNVSPGKNVVYGAGMCFRSSLLSNALSCGFNFMFDYVKDAPSLKKMSNGGEDGELCWAIKYQNFEIHYFDKLKFYHIIDKHKFNLDYLSILKSRKSKFTLIAQVYWRVENMDALYVKNFWLKEIFYIIVNFVRNFEFKKSYIEAETIRNFSNLTFLVSYRSKYDAIINRLLKYKSNFT